MDHETNKQFVLKVAEEITKLPSGFSSVYILTADSNCCVLDYCAVQSLIEPDSLKEHVATHASEGIVAVRCNVDGQETNAASVESFLAMLQEGDRLYSTYNNATERDLVKNFLDVYTKKIALVLPRRSEEEQRRSVWERAKYFPGCGSFDGKDFVLQFTHDGKDDQEVANAFWKYMISSDPSEREEVKKDFGGSPQWESFERITTARRDMRELLEKDPYEVLCGGSRPASASSGIRRKSKSKTGKSAKKGVKSD
ncbi:hypothetical protein SCHPADRAFT_943437 [Schizopora paradoxa]|uniref:Uncharacterized protein n=1 Tax=Schizopora paradoxa TaxID=27342 RepID=A0A0H2RJU3_9AGAM|nr:hypothetical protein SCHPADRAFT_943437 [Schizopora paradoxa]